MRLELDRVSVRGLLHDITLAVDRGEIVSIWSTRKAARLALLAVAKKIRRPDSGSVVSRGTVLLAQRHWPDAGGPHVLEQLMLPLIASPGSIAQARSGALGALSEWGIEDWASASVRDLEDYQLARLSLIRALLARPDVLLVDDPVSGLDPTYAEPTLQLLRIARERGTAVLVTTSTVEAMRDADGLFTINQGVLRGERPGQAKVIPLQRRSAV